MQDWIVVSLAAFVYSLVVFAFNRVFKIDEHNRRMREMSERMRKNPDSISEEELAEHLRSMYRVMGLRLAMLFIVFYPLYYAFSSRYGNISTPLWTMNWLWWFVISSIAANLVIGGVMKWLAPSKGD